MARRIAGSVATIVALVLAAPALASAQATKPTVTTGGIAKLATQSVTLLGKVNPKGAATTYVFQYGPTSAYGTTTAPISAGGGAKLVNAVADIAGLAPATTYHYRLVATNRLGQTKGADRTLKTRPQPLGLSLAATPNPVGLGKPTVLAGALTGTGNAGKQVVLLANPFPYTQGFAAVGNAQITDAQGAFSFALLSVALNTQYRVQIATSPEIMSPIVGVSVAISVSTQVSSTKVRRGRLVRFSGSIGPARPGAQVAIQKQRGTNWITVAGTITRTATTNFSRYAKRVRVRRGGNYRVFVAVNDGNFVSNTGRTVRIRTR